MAMCSDGNTDRLDNNKKPRPSALRSVFSVVRRFWIEGSVAIRLEAFIRLALVVVVQLFRGRASIWLSTERRQQMQALLGSPAGTSTVQPMLRYLLALVALSPIPKLYWRLMRGLRMLWGRELVRQLLAGLIPVQCMAIHSADENTQEQRVAADANNFVQLATSLSLEMLDAIITLTSQMLILRQLSPILGSAVVGTAIFGTVFTGLISSRMPELVRAERRAVSRFQWGVARVREHCEEISFNEGEAAELKVLDNLLIERERTEWNRFALKDVVQLCGTIFKSSAGLIPVLVMSFSEGAVSEGAAVMQAVEAFQEGVSSMLVLSDNASDCSRLASIATTLDGYFASVERAQASSSQLALVEPDINSDLWLETQQLTLWHPSNRTVLLKELSFKAPTHSGLLITGSSGVGKTTLLRAIAGLWPHGEGAIIRVAAAGQKRIMFLPQRPYMVMGTLREQLMYPFEKGQLEVPHNRLVSALESLGLAHVTGTDLEVTRQWDRELSIGEQQRLAMARLVVQQPLYAILDEATSANDPANERLMYQCVASVCTAFVSVGHRKSLEEFHVNKLTLLGAVEGGAWKLS